MIPNLHAHFRPTLPALCLVTAVVASGCIGNDPGQVPSTSYCGDALTAEEVAVLLPGADEIREMREDPPGYAALLGWSCTLNSDDAELRIEAAGKGRYIDETADAESWPPGRGEYFSLGVGLNGVGYIDDSTWGRLRISCLERPVSGFVATLERRATAGDNSTTNLASGDENPFFRILVNVAERVAVASGCGDTELPEPTARGLADITPVTGITACDIIPVSSFPAPPGTLVSRNDADPPLPSRSCVVRTADDAPGTPFDVSFLASRGFEGELGIEYLLRNREDPPLPGIGGRTHRQPDSLTVHLDCADGPAVYRMDHNENTPPLNQATVDRLFTDWVRGVRTADGCPLPS